MSDRRAKAAKGISASELLPRLRPPDGFRVARFGHVAVHRPNEASNRRVRGVLAEHAKRRRLGGFYDGSEQVNHAIQELYELCRQVFVVALARVRNRGMAEFMLEQHENWNLVHVARSRGLHPALCDEYDRTGPTARLAIQWILENCVKDGIASGPTCPPTQLVFWTDAVVVAAEEMVRLSLHSTVAHSLAPGLVTIEITPDRRDSLYDLRFRSPFGSGYESLVRRAQAPVPARYSDLHSPGDIEQVLTALDGPFREVLGLTLRDCIGVLGMLEESTRPPPTGFPVPFVLVDRVRTGLAANLDRSLDQVDRVLAAFTLTAEQFAGEDRELWRPRQDHRMQRRPVLRLPHELGPHYCWKGGHLRESAMFVLQEMCFKRLPREWRHPVLERAVDDLSRQLDEAWEAIVHDQLLGRGLAGCRGIRKIQVDGAATRLDAIPGVGEIDGLYAEVATGLLIVTEVKRTQPSYGPVHYRADLSAYAEGERSYAATLRRKASWVSTHWRAVCEHLALQGVLKRIPDELPDVRMVLITKYECFASLVVASPPIVSLVTLLTSCAGPA